MYLLTVNVNVVKLMLIMNIHIQMVYVGVVKNK